VESHAAARRQLECVVVVGLLRVTRRRFRDQVEPVLEGVFDVGRHAAHAWLMSHSAMSAATVCGAIVVGNGRGDIARLRQHVLPNLPASVRDSAQPEGDARRRRMKEHTWKHGEDFVCQRRHFSLRSSNRTAFLHRLRANLPAILPFALGLTRGSRQVMLLPWHCRERKRPRSPWIQRTTDCRHGPLANGGVSRSEFIRQHVALVLEQYRRHPKPRSGGIVPALTERGDERELFGARR
jgi:hypothetical protein